jgi:hypothetical protein
MLGKLASDEDEEEDEESPQSNEKQSTAPEPAPPSEEEQNIAVFEGIKGNNFSKDESEKIKKLIKEGNKQILSTIKVYKITRDEEDFINTISLIYKKFK